MRPASVPTVAGRLRSGNQGQKREESLHGDGYLWGADDVDCCRGHRLVSSLSEPGAWHAMCGVARLLRIGSFVAGEPLAAM